MHPSILSTALQLRSLVQADGRLQISLEPTPVPVPGADEVLIQMQATPINPSDMGLLFGPADLSTVQVAGSAQRPVVTARKDGLPDAKDWEGKSWEEILELLKERRAQYERDHHTKPAHESNEDPAA